jgi:hypothetical protein
MKSGFYTIFGRDCRRTSSKRRTPECPILLIDSMRSGNTLAGSVITQKAVAEVAGVIQPQVGDIF